MPENRYSRRIPDQIWDRHKSTILRLYLSDNRPLTASGGVKDIMYLQHGFSATKAQYETKLKKWRSYKYASAHDRNNQASILEDYEGDDLNTEGQIEAPNIDFRNIAIRTSSPHRSAIQSAPLSSRTLDLVSSTSSSLWQGPSSVSMSSVTIPFPVFRCEVGSIFTQYHTSSYDATQSVYGLCDSAWNVPNSFPSHTTDLLSDLAVPDFATSMIPVISRLFPRASLAAHMILFGNSAAIESAIISMSHPSALPLLREQSIDHQVVYMVLQHLINHDDVVRTLDKPGTELDRFFKAGIKHCFSLGPTVLSSIIKCTQTPYHLALIQSVFRAALFLGDGAMLNGILSMDSGSLVNRSVLLGESHYYPLEYTSLYGHIQATEVLLDHGADPNRQKGRSFLLSVGFRPWKAQEQFSISRVPILRLLIARGLNIDPDSAVARMESCNLDELQLLVTSCLDQSFNAFFIYEGLPIVLLRQDWDDSLSSIINTIIERASSDYISHQELWEYVLSESLAVAVLRNHSSACAILLTSGAKPNVHCLISAVRRNDLRFVKDFLKCGVDPNAQRSRPFVEKSTIYWRKYDEIYGRDQTCTALGESVTSRSTEAFGILQEQGFIEKLSDQPAGFVSAFVAACKVGNSTLIEQLLALESFPGKLPGIEEALQTALEEDQHHIIEKLLSVGVKPTTRCLELAIGNKQLTAVRMLANCFDLTATVETEIRNGKIPPYQDEQYYANSILFEVLRWGNRTAIGHILSLEFPVNALFHVNYKQFPGWNLDPGLHPRGRDASWYLTPLSAAILKDDMTLVSDLMAHGTQAVLYHSRLTSYRGIFRTESPSETMILTPLTAAAIKKNIALIEELLQIGADPFDNSALFVCAVLDLPEISAVLLHAFKSRYPNGAKNHGCDALYQTIRSKNARLFSLFAFHINLSGPVAKDHGRSCFDGRRFESNTVWTSPLGEAIRLHSEGNGADAMFELLLSMVKDHSTVVYRDSERGNMTCLLSAIYLDSLKTVHKLHQAGANISLPAMGSVIRTPLQAAAQVASQEIVEYLLGHGVDPNEPPSTRSGATALQLAAISGNVNIASILVDAGADVNAPPAFCDGRTAFEGATEHGRIEMMRFLVSKGADLLANDNEQHRRAVILAEDNRQYAAKALADELHARVVASQQTSFINMGGQWAGSEMPDLGTLFS